MTWHGNTGYLVAQDLTLPTKVRTLIQEEISLLTDFFSDSSESFSWKLPVSRFASTSGYFFVFCLLSFANRTTRLFIFE
jgi:hypothetical protein